MSEDFKRRLGMLEKQMRDPNSAIHIDGLLVSIEPLRNLAFAHFKFTIANYFK